jgi:CheY-like chemotaxis protein
LGEGSHFIVVLPIQKTDQLIEIPLQSNKRQLKPALVSSTKEMIWLIDDDQTLLEMTSSVLRSIGMKVESFSDPLNALKSFTKGCADLLIMDIQMPGMNGVELLKKIQEKNEGFIPAIAISGMDAGQNVSPGFSAYIQKPFHPKTLIDVVLGQHIGVEENDRRKIPSNPGSHGYNLDQLAAFASGDRDTFREILCSLIHTGKENVILFRQFIERNDKDALAALSHKMLTLFRQMEATDIVELLSRLEHDNDGPDSHQYFLWGKLALEKIEVLLQTIEKEEHIAVA